MQRRAKTKSDRASLPVPEFDLLPVGCLPSRIHALDIEQVEQLIGYERNHAERIQVLDLLEHRRDQLRRHTLAAVPNE
jgi:hypothetical protein